MNRRRSLQLVVVLGCAALTTKPILTWLIANEPINVDLLLKKKAIIAELAEMIIPTTESPGAKDCFVEHYIINVVLHCNSPKDQERFISGLEKLEAYTKKQFGMTFLECKPADKMKVLNHFSNQRNFSSVFINKIEDKLFGKPFFQKFRELTVEGYCQSKLGATLGLAYSAIPGEYQSCITSIPNQKSWATK